ncbi:hypothetical protein SBRCBS47491_007571 [Sporothrix bragantina]|uniref:Uncharacterized protein n=1 Tax=Sporothrix bragantina TaxID=671064 RepID=A0ABP0CEA8_9PEZI
MDTSPVLPGFMDLGALRQGTLMTLITKNDMLYSGMMDDVSPNLIPFQIATICELAGSDAQMERAYQLHKNNQRPLRPVIETELPMESHIDEFRTYYARRLVTPGAPLRDNLIAELFQGAKAPLWMGLFACYGLPLVHLSDSMEVKSATYAKQALALAASNLDEDLCALFGAIVTESRQRSSLFGPSPMSSTAGSTTGSSSSRSNSRPPPFFAVSQPEQQHNNKTKTKKWTCDPLSILRALSRDGRLSNLSLVLPGYVAHAQAGRSWSTQPVVGQVVLESVWQWDVAETIDPLDALEELGRVAVTLACGTHKPDEPPEYDIYLCLLPTLVLSLRVFLGGVRQQYPAVSEIALVLVRCLWAQMVLVYILQLRPKVHLLSKAKDSTSSATDRGDDFLLSDFYADNSLSEPRHHDAFYLRALRSFAMLAAVDRDPAWTAWISEATVVFQSRWQRWVGLSSYEAATLDIRL